MSAHVSARSGQTVVALALIAAGVWALMSDLDVGDQAGLVAEAGLPVPGFLAVAGLFTMLVGIMVLSLRR